MIDRKRLISWLLLLASLSLIYSWPLQVVSGYKIGYWIFAAISAVIFLLTLNSRWSPFLFLYCLTIFMVVFMQISFNLITFKNIFLPLVLYLLVPSIYGRCIFDEDRFNWLSKTLLICAPINIFGLLLQFYGYTGNFFILEQTETLGVVHDRYTSFLGGSLSLGYISMFNAICSFLFMVKDKRLLNYIYYGPIFLMSLCTLYSAFTRRFYLLLIIAIMVILFKITNWRKYLIPIVAFFMIAVTFVICVKYNTKNGSFNILFLDRLVSTFDISGDDIGNQMRILKGFQAVEWSLSSPYLGLGAGSVGTIGKSIEELSEKYEESIVAESYFLHMAVDFGIVVAVIFLCLMIYLFIKSASRFILTGSTVALFLVIYPIDCISSLELAAPFPALIFWLCAGILFSVIVADDKSNHACII